LRAIIYREIIMRGPASGTIRLNGRNSALITRGISPHSPYTVSEALLRSLAATAMRSHTRLAMHVAESRDEVNLLLRRTSGLARLYELANWNISEAPAGNSPVEYLLRTGILSPRLLAVHAVHVSDKDIRTLKTAGVAIAHCPRSNRETRVGRMPLDNILAAGIPVGLGTDSLASTPSLNMWDEMRFAYRTHRRCGITPRDIVSMATLGGATSLGLEKLTGSLDRGKRADIIAVPMPKRRTADLYSDLLRETKTCIMTMVSGRIIYRDLMNQGASYE